MEEGAATMSRGRGTCHEIPARLFMTRWKRLCVGSGMRRLRACLLLRTLNRQLLTFSLQSRDGWKILIIKLQVTILEWSAWPPAAAPIWDLFEVWPPPTPWGKYVPWLLGALPPPANFEQMLHVLSLDCESFKTLWKKKKKPSCSLKQQTDRVTRLI